MMEQEYLKVSELNKFIKDVINAGFPQTVWVCGEIQQYDRSKNKRHIFFELVEKEEGKSDIVARIGLVIFANRKDFIENVLKKSDNAFELKDDIEVKFECKVDFYAPHGAVRLIVENIDPFYTLGKLAQERLKTIKMLKEKGLLDKNKELQIPLVPLNIGLITSDESAAFNDFIDELRNSGLGFNVYLRNTIMQGKNAEKDVCKAIDVLENKKCADVIVITRGGGSIADLSCFDSPVIVERISKCKLPILSGIGHEINLSIVDMAAHTYAKTPTAIAKFLVEKVIDYISELNEGIDRVLSLSEDMIADEKQRISDIAHGLQNNTLLFLKDHREHLVKIQEALRIRPGAIVKQESLNLGNYSRELIKALGLRFSNEKNRIKNIDKLVEMAHPINTMKRGFSVARDKDGKIIRKITDVSKGSDMFTELADGKIVGNVKELIKEEKSGRS